MKMRKTILIAPTEFKGSLSAGEVAEVIGETLQAKAGDKFEIIERPISDGGDGFVSTLEKALEVETFNIEVSAPYGNDIFFDVPIAYDRKTNTAFVESAEVLGLKKVPRENRNPLFLSSRGLGEILHALNEINERKEREINRVIIGLGGTATHDAGLGVASVFGSRLSRCSRALPVLPRFFMNADKITFDKKDFDLNFELEVVADVENPLTGQNGSVEIYAAQKGANESDKKILEKGFVNILKRLRISGDGKYYGAGGGLAFGLHYFFNAKIIPAKKFIENYFLKEIEHVSHVVTGEGKLDEQTLYGKAPKVVYDYFSARKVSVFFIVGKSELESAENFTIIETVKFYDNEKQSVENPKHGLRKAAELLGELILEEK
jgi:glycerate kinase